MGIIAIVKGIFPDIGAYVLERLEQIRQPRFMMSGDILRWVNLRGQINAKTGRINSYRDIRKICEATGDTIPSLGTLRNYLGEGGKQRIEIAKTEWKAWFEEFGEVTEMFKDEVMGLTTKEEWAIFRGEYNSFMGF